MVKVKERSAHIYGVYFSNVCLLKSFRILLVLLCFGVEFPSFIQILEKKEELSSLAYTNWKTTDVTFMKRSIRAQKKENKHLNYGLNIFP